MGLTKAGARLYSEIQELLPNVLAIKEKVAELYKNKEITLGCFPTFLYEVADMLYNNTDLESVTLTSVSRLEQLEMLRKDELDVMLYAGVNLMLEPEFELEEVGSISLACVYPKSSEFNTIKEMAQHYDYIALNSGNGGGIVKHYLSTTNLALQPKVKMDMINHILALIEKSKLWSIIPAVSGRNHPNRMLDVRVNYFYIDNAKSHSLFLLSKPEFDPRLRKIIADKLRVLFS